MDEKLVKIRLFIQYWCKKMKKNPEVLLKTRRTAFMLLQNLIRSPVFGSRRVALSTFE